MKVGPEIPYVEKEEFLFLPLNYFVLPKYDVISSHQAASTAASSIGFLSITQAFGGSAPLASCTNLGRLDPS